MRERLELRAQRLVQLDARHPAAHIGARAAAAIRRRGRLAGVTGVASSSARHRRRRRRRRRGDCYRRATDSVVAGGGGRGRAAEAGLRDHLTRQVAQTRGAGGGRARRARLLVVLHPEPVAGVERSALGHVRHDAAVPVRLVHLQEVLRTASGSC